VTDLLGQQRIGDPEALDRLSWILATDPRPEFRNGTEAVRMATSACSMRRASARRALIARSVVAN